MSSWLEGTDQSRKCLVLTLGSLGNGDSSILSEHCKTCFPFFVKELLLNCTKQGDTGWELSSRKEQEDPCSVRVMFLRGAVEVGVMLPWAAWLPHREGSTGEDGAAFPLWGRFFLHSALTEFVSTQQMAKLEFRLCLSGPGCGRDSPWSEALGLWVTNVTGP